MTSALSAKEGVSYVLGYGVVATAGESVLATATPSPANVLDQWMTAASLLVFVLGTISCYRANGGEEGRDFIGRYVALVWVLGIRWFVMVFVPVVVAVIAVEDFLGEIPVGTSPLEAAAGMLVLIGFFWRLRHHFSEMTPSTIPE